MKPFRIKRSCGVILDIDPDYPLSGANHAPVFQITVASSKEDDAGIRRGHCLNLNKEEVLDLKAWMEEFLRAS